MNAAKEKLEIVIGTAESRFARHLLFTCDGTIKEFMKRVFIVHGWEGYPHEGWYPWLKRQLEDRGFEVSVPQLPDTGSPRISKWIPALAEVVGVPDGETYFVGHSMGCQAIARYLESLPSDIVVGGAVFVAGFFKHLARLGDDPVAQETSRHWLEEPVDLKNVRAHLRGSVAVFSDDDPWVPLDNQDDFRNILNSRIVLERKKGHFAGSDNVIELPIALESVLILANSRQGNE